MKLHLPIALLALTSALSYAGNTYTAQVINNVAEGKVTDPYYLLLFSTANNGPFPGTSVDTPMAVVKDGLGEWQLEKDITVNDPLVVREGTFTIQNSTVLNYTTLNSYVCNLSIGGKSAHLVLDNATYKQDLDYAQNYTSAIAIGTADGKGTVTLKNNSILHTDHYIFAGYHNASGYIKNTTVSSDDSTVYSGGEYGRSTINIESGSTLSAGTCLQFADVDVNIDGEGSKLVDLNRDSTPAGANYSYFGTANNSETNIKVTNGGELKINQYLYTGWGTDSKTNIEISGEGSSMSVAYGTKLGNGCYDSTTKTYYSNGSEVSVSLTDGATATFGSTVDLGYNDTATLKVDSTSSITGLDGGEACIEMYDHGSIENAGSIGIELIMYGGQLDAQDGSTFANVTALAGVLNLDGNITIDGDLILGSTTALLSTESTSNVLTINFAEGATINAENVTLGSGLAINVAVSDVEAVANNTYTLFGADTDVTALENADITFSDGTNTVIATVEALDNGSFKVVSTAAAPEPTTATLSLLALAALAARRRRR